MLDADVDGDVDVVHVVSGNVHVDVGVDVDSDVGGDVKIVRTPSVKWRLHNYAHRSRSMETVLCTERYHGNSEEGYDEDDGDHCVC